MGTSGKLPIVDIPSIAPGRFHLYEVKGWLCGIWNAGEWYCGYVRIPDGHPLHGIHYMDPRVMELDVHGGVTYSQHTKWKEIRYYHDPYLNQAYGIKQLWGDTHRPEAEGWWIGFDTAHPFDEGKWTPTRVVIETMKLLKQLMDYGTSVPQIER